MPTAYLQINNTSATLLANAAMSAAASFNFHFGVLKPDGSVTSRVPTAGPLVSLPPGILRCQVMCAYARQRSRNRAFAYLLKVPIVLHDFNHLRTKLDGFRRCLFCLSDLRRRCSTQKSGQVEVTPRIVRVSSEA